MTIFDGSGWQMIMFFVPVIIGLVEVIKRIGVPDKYAPLIDIILGLVFAYFYADNFNLESKLMIGLITGLTASGLYSSGKVTMKEFINTKE